MRSGLILRNTLALSILLALTQLHSNVQARPSAVQTQPAITSIDRTRLSEAFRLGDQIGDRIWSGWSRAPFAVLLVTPDTEFLIRHPQPSPDFTKIGYDALLKSDVFYRKRNFPATYLATFPAIQGSMISTIVVGQAENTSVKTSTPWVVTLLHEHFHQLQDSQPNFYPDVNALNLSRGDQTGMWMLNYAFPYERKEVQEQFVLMSKLLADVAGEGARAPSEKVRAYLEARRKFQAMLAPDDYKYISFQFWKEGIARYTEYRVAQIAATQFRPSREFRALKDYRSFADVAKTTYREIFDRLASQKLGESKRESSIRMARRKDYCSTRSGQDGVENILSRSLIWGRFGDPLLRSMRLRKSLPARSRE
jgi:hypothetical protein